jgi:N-acetylneuraminic acid mutarotase
MLPTEQSPYINTSKNTSSILLERRNSTPVIYLFFKMLTFTRLAVGAFTLFASTTLVAAADKYCWKSLAPIAGGTRQEHSTGTTGSKILIIGGMVNGDSINKVEIYDIEKDSWSNGPSLPVAMHHPNIASVDGNIYVLGGLTGTTWAATGQSFRYDAVDNKWVKLAEMTDNPSGSSVLGVSGKTVYVASGLQSNGTGRKSSKALASYDITANTWKTYDVLLPEGRDHAGGGLIDGVLYIMGGRLGSPTATRGTTLALNLTAQPLKWVEKTPLPTKRGGFPSVVIGKKIFTFGGEGNSAPSSKGVFPQVEVYDTTTDAWTSLPLLQTPRHGFQGVVIGEKIYLPGGGTAGGPLGPVAMFEAFVPC